MLRSTGRAKALSIMVTLTDKRDGTPYIQKEVLACLHYHYTRTYCGLSNQPGTPCAYISTNMKHYFTPAHLTFVPNNALPPSALPSSAILPLTLRRS